MVLFKVWPVLFSSYKVFEVCEDVRESLLERATGVGHRCSGIHASKKAYMVAALEWKGDVMNMCKRCRLESIMWLSTRAKRG